MTNPENEAERRKTLAMCKTPLEKYIANCVHLGVDAAGAGNYKAGADHFQAALEALAEAIRKLAEEAK